MMQNPYVRWILRAALAAATTFLVTLSAADEPLSRAALAAAVVAVVQASGEYLTPITKTVGVGKA
jgi:hypothetical protein